MKALEIQLYPYKEYPQIIKDFFGYRFKKPIESLFPLFDYISEPVLELGFWKEKYCIIQKGNLFGVIKDDGSIIVPPQYVQIIPKDESFLLLSTDFKWGLLGIPPERFPRIYKDLFFIPCIYDEIGDFSEGYYVVKKDGKYGFAPLLTDNISYYPRYDEVRPFHEGIAAARSYGKWGFIDKTLARIVPFEYDEVGDFKNGVADVWKDDTKMRINYEGNMLKNEQNLFFGEYKRQGSCHEGLFVATNDNKLGFIDTYGNIKIPFDYYPGYLWEGEISYFSEGFACVNNGSFWGYIDKRNRIVFPFILDSCSPIHNGYAIVTDGINWSKIVTIKHFYDYLHGNSIPFHTDRQPLKPKEYIRDYGWSKRDLQNAYEATMENDISNEWNID